DAERIADRQHIVADLQVVGVAERKGVEVVARHADHGQIGVGIAADLAALELAAIPQRNGDVAGMLDHVVVGHDQAGMAVDHHARADRLDLALDRPRGDVEELAKERIVEQRVLLHRHLAGDGDADHRRRGAPDDGSEGGFGVERLEGEEGEEGDEGGEESEQRAHGRSVAAKSGKKLAKSRACRRTAVDLVVSGRPFLEEPMTNVLDAYMVDSDLSFLDKAKIQAQVLVPLVRALRTEMGKDKADALVKKALSAWSREMFAAIGK